MPRRREFVPPSIDELQSAGDRCGAYDPNVLAELGLTGLVGYSEESLRIQQGWRDETAARRLGDATR